jgi:hypothetical protein
MAAAWCLSEAARSRRDVWHGCGCAENAQSTTRVSPLKRSEKTYLRGYRVCVRTAFRTERIPISISKAALGAVFRFCIGARL